MSTMCKTRIPVRRRAMGAVVLVALVMVVGVAVARRPDADPILWTVALNDSPSSLVIDARTGRAFVLGDGYGPFGYRGNVTMLDLASGASLRTVPVGRVPAEMLLDQRVNRLFVMSMAMDDSQGRAFVANSPAGTVSMLDIRRGVVLKTIAVGAHPVMLAVDERRGRLVCIGIGSLRAGSATSPGRISVLDIRSGAVLSSATIGWGPTAMALDERMGRALIANVGGVVRLPDTWAWVPSWLRGRLPFLPPPASRTRLVPGSVTVVDITR